VKLHTFCAVEWMGYCEHGYREISICSRETGKVIVSHEAPENDCYMYVYIAWSPDSRYAGFTHSIPKGPPPTMLFDTVTGRRLLLPTAHDTESAVMQSIPFMENFSGRFDSYSFSIKKWMADGTARIAVTLRYGNLLSIDAEYTIDLSIGEISDFTYKITDLERPVGVLTEAELRKLADTYLHRLAAAGKNKYFERDIIAFSPITFLQLVALGKDVVPYLNKIAYDPGYGGAAGNQCRIMAQAASYAIDPSQYDRFFPSPDGKYALKASIHSFFIGLDPYSSYSYKLSVTHPDTGEVLIDTDQTINFGSFLLQKPLIHWSPDSSYVAIQQGYRHNYSSVYLLDIARGSVYELPDKTEFESLLGIPFAIIIQKDSGGMLHDETYNCFHVYFDKWNKDSIELTLTLSTNSGAYIDIGRCTWSLSEQKITDLALSGELPVEHGIPYCHDLARVLEDYIDALP